jgi:extracellular elastinolytic metalloproteinase
LVGRGGLLDRADLLDYCRLGHRFIRDWVSVHKLLFAIADFLSPSTTAGFRTRPYSTSKSVNPYTYATAKTKSEEHDIGEVWANILVNVYAAFVAAWGFSDDARKTAFGSGGNTYFLQLLLDGMALQPCNPTFLSARDAIIQADALRYGGRNKCMIWKAFASRGLGTDAASYVDSSTIPSGC